MLHRRGITIQGCFVFGFDHDDKSVFDVDGRSGPETGHRHPALLALHTLSRNRHYSSG